MKKNLHILFFLFCIFSVISCKSRISSDGLATLASKIRPDFMLGAFSSGLTSADGDTLKELFKNEFSITTIGVYMKQTQAGPDSFKLKNVDELVDFAGKNGIVIYFHPLIGSNTYTPEWVSKGNFTNEELLKIMRQRIATILTRYGNKVSYTDVVNEALTGTDPAGNTIWNTRDHVWMNLGWRDNDTLKWPVYLEQAFRIACEAGGASLKLIYNDNNNAMMDSPRAESSLRLFRDFKKAGIPIDGIGMQFHCAVKDGQLREGAWGKGVPVDFDSFARNMHRFAEEGVEIHITEFDVHLPENPSETDIMLQATAYREALKRCLEEPACKSFKPWGFTDKYSWKPQKYNAHPLMFDANFKPKPAYMEMKKMMLEKIAKNKS